MKQETLDAMRSWLDGETLEYRSTSTPIEWKMVVPHSECEGLPFLFDDSDEYRIKPRTIRIGEYDVPEPERKAPAMGTVYHIPFFGFSAPIDGFAWDNDLTDKRHLANGMVHLNREAAEIHAKAIISFTEVKP